MDYVCTQEELGGPNWVQVEREEALGLYKCGVTIYWDLYYAKSPENPTANSWHRDGVGWSVVADDTAFDPEEHFYLIYKVEVE